MLEKQITPKSLRPHIVIVGRMNVGKSSLLNAITEQLLVIVSNIPGTTTDPVEKAVELLPYGPVSFVDTAGIDDTGPLGKERVKKTYNAMGWADIILLVVTPEIPSYEPEKEIIKYAEEKRIPVILVVNKAEGIDETERERIEKRIREELKVEKIFFVSAKENIGIKELRSALAEYLNQKLPPPPPLVADLVSPGDIVLLVVPIDLEAPAGRLINPQVQVIRELLDADAIPVVVKDKELISALEKLREKPKLVITDSQVVMKVVGDLPPDIPMTTFSILFTRFKGDLLEMIKGVVAIDTLEDGDKVLIAEACTHHTLPDDIGKVKIPRWLSLYTGKKLIIEHSNGFYFPENLSEYRLVIHCGGCMINRRQMLTRIDMVKSKDVPITNYGVAISFLHGVLERALSPFPEALMLYKELKNSVYRKV